jgi:hypothetical protein
MAYIRRRWGAPGARSMMRLYDKRAEGMAAGSPDPGAWVSVEVQYPGDVAGAVARAVANGEMLGPLIARVCRWLDGPPSSHAERGVTAAWFAHVAEHTRLLGLKRRAKPGTAERAACVRRIKGVLADTQMAKADGHLVGLAHDEGKRSEPALRARVAAYWREWAELERRPR